MENKSFIEILKSIHGNFLHVEKEYKKLSTSENDIQNYSHNAIFELYKFKYNNLHSFCKVLASVFFNFEEEKTIVIVADENLRQGFEKIEYLYSMINDDDYSVSFSTIIDQIKLARDCFDRAKSSYLKNAKPRDNSIKENLHSIIKYILSGFKDDMYFVLFNKLFIASLMESYCYKLITEPDKENSGNKRTIVDKKFNETECYFYLRLFYQYNSGDLNSLKKKIDDKSLEYSIFDEDANCSRAERKYKRLQDEEEIFIKIAKDIFKKEIVKTFSGNPKCTKKIIDNPKSDRPFATTTISYTTFKWLPEIFKNEFPAI